MGQNKIGNVSLFREETADFGTEKGQLLLLSFFVGRDPFELLLQASIRKGQSLNKNRHRRDVTLESTSLDTACFMLAKSCATP